jgi:hypothetical protein
MFSHSPHLLCHVVGDVLNFNSKNFAASIIDNLNIVVEDVSHSLITTTLFLQMIC